MPDGFKKDRMTELPRREKSAAIS